MDDLIDTDWEDDLDVDLHLSPTITMSNCSDTAQHDEVHNFLSEKIQ
jgi:hypothetical protein